MNLTAVEWCINMDEISWINILLAALAVIVPIILLFISQRKKKLSCIFHPFFSLVDIRNEVKDRIKIFYNDELAENLSMRKVTIKNSGNLSIRKEDIIKPLEFVFENHIKIMDFRVTELKEEGIEIELKHNADINSIQCSFDLLNKGDEFTMEFVYLGEAKKSPNVISRIDGIKRIGVEDYTFSDVKEKRMQFVGNAYIILGPLISISGLLLAIFYTQNPIFYSLILAGIFTFILGFSAKKSPSKLHNFLKKMKF